MIVYTVTLHKLECGPTEEAQFVLCQIACIITNYLVPYHEGSLTRCMGSFLCMCYLAAYTNLRTIRFETRAKIDQVVKLIMDKTTPV